MGESFGGYPAGFLDPTHPTTFNTRRMIRAMYSGVGVVPGHQRRGVCGALMSVIVEDAIASGCDCVFLSAGDDATARVYARVGFVAAGTAMDTMEEPPPDHR